MTTAQVAEFADRSVDSLSGGQRQRCWIAVALAQETDLILLDEPTISLYLKVQLHVVNLLADLAHKTGHTLVMVLHELSIAAAYADTLVMMQAGRIVCTGAPKGSSRPLTSRPYSTWTRPCRVTRFPAAVLHADAGRSGNGIGYSGSGHNMNMAAAVSPVVRTSPWLGLQLTIGLGSGAVPAHFGRCQTRAHRCRVPGAHGARSGRFQSHHHLGSASA